MDVVYIYKNSIFNDFEIRYSLRSIERHFPHVGKVWIYGDRPHFLVDDTSLVEHVSDLSAARIFRIQPPVSNMFRLYFFASLIPALTFEYLYFCDDFILLEDLSLEDARKVRYLEDMRTKTSRGRGLWVDQLWRTYDTLTRLGYPGYNFETHTPMYLTRKWVFEAYSALCDFVTDDKWYGMVAPSAIMNHAYQQEPMPITLLSEEGSRCGYWGKQPEYETIKLESVGRKFFNFDDFAFGENIARFLMERFPEPSRYEKD